MLRHHRVVVLAAGLAGLAGVACRAHAQTPIERATLDSMRAVFTAVTDSAYLISYERLHIAAARQDRDNPLLHMDLGFAAFRLGELTGARKRYQDAASEFQWVADLRPAWPYAWYHLGLAELLTGESSLIIVENLRQMMGQDALSLAARSFARAVEVDPSFSEGLVGLANAAMRQRINPRLAVAQSALRQAAGTAAGRVPEVQLLRGRVERRLSDNDSALAAFRAYVAVGGDSVIGGVEIARTQALLGHPDSASQTYFAAGMHTVSDSARREIRKDLRWFATTDELDAFERTPPDSLGLWLRRFWIGRDLEDGRRLGERLSEQFRRYQYAVNNYSLVSKRRGYDVGFAYADTTQQEFDDRGVIYLRHGEPTVRTTHNSSGYEPNESWAYRRDPPQSDLIVHFMALNDVQDYRLVQSLLNICTQRFNSDPLIRTESDQVSRWGDCVLSRAPLSPDYDRLGRLAASASPGTWASERTNAMRMVREATTTDSYTLRFAHELAPIVSLFAVADNTMSPEVHLVFAVPAARLHPAITTQGDMAYPLALRMLLFDSVTHRVVAALDTVRTFRSGGRLPDGAYLTEQLVLRAPAGHWRYSFVIQELNGSTGDAVSNRSIEIPALNRPFSVSDVVMGREGSGLVWRRPEGEVQLNPLMKFRRDGEALLFYELYGLPQGANIATRVRIQREGGRSIFRRVFGGGGGLDVAYTTVTDAPGRTRVNQTVDLHGLTPGRYRLEIEFTDPVSGRQVTRYSPFEIEAARAS